MPESLRFTCCKSRCITSLRNGEGTVSPQEGLSMLTYLRNLIMIAVQKNHIRFRLIGKVSSKECMFLRPYMRQLNLVCDIWGIGPLTVWNVLLLKSKRFFPMWCFQHTLLVVFLKLNKCYSLNEGCNRLLYVTTVGLPDSISVVPVQVKEEQYYRVKNSSWIRKLD